MTSSGIRSPLACFITFRTYGTWLHGDDRGSVDRKHNVYGTPRLPWNPPRLAFEDQSRAIQPVRLERDRRECTRVAIRETCCIRNWLLYALNVRTNHVHVVVTTDTSGKQAMAAFKAYATAAMRKSGCWTDARSPWAHSGSVRLLWTQSQVERATSYVLFGQGVDLD